MVKENSTINGSAEDGGRKGKLIGVGTGPGDPELLTIKGYRVLQQSPVIAFPDSGKRGKGYSYTITEGLFDHEEKVMLPLDFPMTRDRSVLEKKWEEAARAIHDHLEQGLDVAFITEGDPLFYSTFIHLMRTVEDNFPGSTIEVVAGVTSMQGAAAALAAPVADGDQRLAVVPATDDMEENRKIIEQFDTIVFLKIAKVLQPMIDLLESLGLGSSSSVVTKATSGDQILYRELSALKDVSINYLSIMIVDNQKRTKG